MNSSGVLLVRELSVLGETNQLLNHPVLPELETNGFFSNQRFTFVGVYYSSNTHVTVIGYPKYLPEHIETNEIPEVINHVNLICQVVEQAQPYLEKSLIDSSYAFHSYVANKKRQYVNRYSLANSILQDYMTYGIYYSKTMQVVRNGNGLIQWQRTIQRVIPILDRDVVYLDVFHRKIRQDYTQLITHLHIWIVLQCARVLQGIGQYQELELPESEIAFDDVELSQFVPYLLSKLTSVFSDREIRLIKALSAWCGQTSFYRSQIGVTKFDKIWEYATKKVFGNVEDTRSGPPSYFIEREEFKAQGDAIPDILRVFKRIEDGRCVIGILDAKYYCPQLIPESHVIYGAPANADIAKQIGYLRYMKQLYPQPHIDFTNAFLFPYMMKKQEALLEYIGYTTPNNNRYDEIDSLLNIESTEADAYQDRVLIYNVNPTVLYKACLREKKIDECTFYNSFVVPFGEHSLQL